MLNKNCLKIITDVHFPSHSLKSSSLNKSARRNKEKYFIFTMDFWWQGVGFLSYWNLKKKKILVIFTD
jgi:hypothetical protein